MASFLIADEDRNFREALAIALRLDGHDAAAVGDADAARAWLAAGRIDCCLVDAHLRGADGLLDVAARAGIRTFATGPHADLLAAAAARHPRAGVLPKPLRASELEACVQEVASGRRAAAG
jgi:DNA-binding NtrC family response regulator